jgi:beta-galactosidase
MTIMPIGSTARAGGTNSRWSGSSAGSLPVRLLDENGTLVPNADAATHFEISGPGKILALDSGSTISTERFQSNERKAYQGRAMAIIRSTTAGKVSLTAKVADLPATTIDLTVTP